MQTRKPLLSLLAALLLMGCGEARERMKTKVTTVAKTAVMNATEDAAEAAAATVSPSTAVSVALPIIETQCPLSVGHGAMMESVQQEDSTVVFLCAVDEQQVAMNFLADNPSAVKERSMSMMQANSQAKLFMRMCAKAGYSFLYRYVGQTTGQTVEIPVSNAELLRQFEQ